MMASRFVRDDARRYFLTNKIENAFLPGRGRFIWTPQHSSRVQSECECDPRSILVMYSMGTMVTTGKSIEDTVIEASLMLVEANQYSADAIRLEAALLIDAYKPCMTIRLRRRRNHPNGTAANIGVKKKCKRGMKYDLLEKEKPNITRCKESLIACFVWEGNPG